MKKIIKVVLIIIAALIGAGFASGQELYAFFFKYGIKGMYGLVVGSILLACIIYKTFKILQLEHVDNYKSFINLLIGKINTRKYLNFGFIFNTVVNIFLMVTFFIMIAGFGAYFSQELEISSFIGSALLALICFVTFMTDVNGVIRISSILIPILICFIVLIGIININTIDISSSLDRVNGVSGKGWLISSILYCSYNSILLIPMLIPIRKYIINNKCNMFVAVLSGVVIFILALSIFWLLPRIENNIDNIEMPALYVIGNYFSNFRTIYAFIILSSIYTTAISIGISLLENITNSKKGYIYCATFICTIGFFVSGFGFSNLVSSVYPIFGFLGLIQISAILLHRS